MNKNTIVQGYMAGYMNKEAQQPYPDQGQLPGQGMGPGMQPASLGFPLNPAMANAQAASGTGDQQAMMEEQQKQKMQEQELADLEQVRLDTNHEAKKQKMTGDIYKNQIQIKKTQEDLSKAQTDVANEEALSTMINTSSPGE